MNSLLAEYKRRANELMSEMAIVWLPHAGQLPIVLDFIFKFMLGVFVQCGRKFGKTDLAIYLCYFYALLIPNSEVYYIADEKDHARDICWDNGRLPRFFTTFSQQEGESDEQYQERKKFGQLLHRKYVANTNNTEMSVKLMNGSIIKVDGAKNFSKADGLSPAFVVYDEFKHHDARYDQAMRPNLKAKKGRLLIIGTPPGDEENYYCKTAKEFQDRERHAYYKRPCYMNPHVYKGKDDPALVEDERLARMKGEYHIFAREYLAEIYPDENSAIFPMFANKHVLQYELLRSFVLENRKQWSYHLHFDPASTSTFAALIVAINTYDKRIIILDEVYETKQMNTVTKLVYPKAVGKCKEIRRDMWVWRQGYDVAAAWFATEVAHEYEEGLIPCDKQSVAKEVGLSLIKEAMLFDRFYISDRCVHTIKEIKGYKKDENGRIPKENDHNIDNLRYILVAEGYNFVPRDPLPPITERRGFTMEEDVRNMGGQEEEGLDGVDPFKELTDEYYE